mgnify:CR=1 FL=1
MEQEILEEIKKLRKDVGTIKQKADVSGLYGLVIVIGIVLLVWTTALAAMISTPSKDDHLDHLMHRLEEEDPTITAIAQKLGARELAELSYEYESYWLFSVLKARNAKDGFLTVGEDPVHSIGVLGHIFDRASSQEFDRKVKELQGKRPD